MSTPENGGWSGVYEETFQEFFPRINAISPLGAKLMSLTAEWTDSVASAQINPCLETDGQLIRANAKISLATEIYRGLELRLNTDDPIWGTDFDEVTVGVTNKTINGLLENTLFDDEPQRRISLIDLANELGILFRLDGEEAYSDLA